MLIAQEVVVNDCGVLASHELFELEASAIQSSPNWDLPYPRGDTPISVNLTESSVLPRPLMKRKQSCSSHPRWQGIKEKSRDENHLDSLPIH